MGTARNACCSHGTNTSTVTSIGPQRFVDVEAMKRNTLAELQTILLKEFQALQPMENSLEYVFWMPKRLFWKLMFHSLFIFVFISTVLVTIFFEYCILYKTFHSMSISLLVNTTSVLILFQQNWKFHSLFISVLVNPIGVLILFEHTLLLLFPECLHNSNSVNGWIDFQDYWTVP